MEYAIVTFIITRPTYGEHVSLFASKETGLPGTSAPRLYADVSSTAVPAPATILLFGTGIAGLVGTRIRRKKK